MHNLTIDAKGRLKIPTRHQLQIDKICAGKIVLSIHPDDACLLLYPLKDWQVLEDKVSALPSLNIHSKRLKRKLIGYATDCELDSVSRLLIPTTLREYANIDKKIIMSGQGHNFELWNESAWHKHLDSLDSLSKRENIPTEVSQLSL